MRYFVILILTASILACENKNINVGTDIAPKETIDSLINQWHVDAAEANFDQYMGLMDSISVFIGTDASENWTKEEFMSFSKPYFDRGRAWDFAPMERNIYFSQDGKVAWFDELLDTWMGTCRGSGVLEQSNNSWTLKHYVLSIEVPNDDVQAVILAKHQGDSLFQAQFRGE